MIYALTTLVLLSSGTRDAALLAEARLFPESLLSAVGYRIDLWTESEPRVRKLAGKPWHFTVGIHVQATHPESGARFTLVSEQRVEPGFWGGIASGPRQSEVNITRSPISRLPMGFHFAAAHAGSSGRSLDVEMNHEMVRAWVQYPGAHEAFKGDRTRFDGSAANVLLESTARVTFGRVCGVRFAAADDTLLGTQNIRTWRSEHTDTVAYDLAEWAVARGWSVGTPDKVPCVTLTKEGREILLPLAAMQAKVDGQWRDLGDCVAEKEGRWLVPASLDDLVQ